MRQKRDDPTIADIRGKLPSPMPDRLNPNQLENFSNDDLLDYARRVARSTNLRSIVDLSVKQSELASILEARGLLSKVFTPISIPTPPDSAPQSRRSLMPEPPVRLSIAPKSDPKLLRPEPPSQSIAYEPTELSERSLFDGATLARFNSELFQKEIPLREKIDLGSKRFEQERVKAKAHFGNISVALKNAKLRKSAHELLSRDEEYLIELDNLRETIQTLQSLASNRSEIVRAGPQTTAVVDKVEDLKPEEKPAEKVKKTFDIFGNPIIFSGLGAAIFSGCLHITNSFNDIAQILPTNIENWIKNLAVIGIWYSAITTIFIATEFLRKKEVKITQSRLEILGKLDPARKELYDYAVDFFSTVVNESRDLSLQAKKIQSNLSTDDKLIEAVDFFYSEKELWGSIVQDSSISPTIDKLFSTIKMKADVKIVFSRLLTVSQLKAGNERATKFKILYSTDELFKKRIGEVFGKNKIGQYKNPRLRESLIDTTLNKSGVDVKSLLDELEEIYDNIKGEE